MITCPACGVNLGLFRQEACISCGANLTDHQRVEDQETPEQRAAAGRRAALGEAAFASIFFYALLMIYMYLPKAYFKAIPFLEKKLLGRSPTLFGWGLLTVLFLPLPVALYHFAIIKAQARWDGFDLESGKRLEGGGTFTSTLLYLNDVHHHHPELAKSRWICLGWVAYLVVVVIGLIGYASRLGI